MAGAKFSAEVPKGDGWGIDEAVMDAVRRIQNHHEKSPMIPIIGVVDIKEIKVDPETGNVTPVVRVRRMEALDSVDQIRTAQRLIMERWAERKGEGAVLPFEFDDVLQRAFEGSKQPVGEALQDDEEQQIDAGLDEAGRMRRHLVAVHDYDPNWALDETVEQAGIARKHDEEHDKDAEDQAFPAHDRDSTLWRRVDMAEMLADDEEPTEEPVGEPIIEQYLPLNPDFEAPADDETSNPDE